MARPAIPPSTPPAIAPECLEVEDKDDGLGQALDVALAVEEADAETR